MKKTMRKVQWIIFLVLTLQVGLNAQIAVNTDGSSPDASAILDVSSTDKGILIPRMDSTSRNSISSPATGLMVYDTDNNSFWYYNGTTWTAVGEAAAFVSENNITTSVNNSDDFVFGTDNLDWNGGTETKFFFDKDKAAFRAGEVLGTYWDAGNIGSYSTAFGKNNTSSGHASLTWGQSNTASSYYASAWGYSNTANGFYSTAWGESNIGSGEYTTVFGKNNTASGDYSTVWGIGLEAPSYGETTLGMYGTTYFFNSSFSFDSADRLFVLGNGTDDANRSDALIVYKSGNTEINGDLTISGSLILEDTTEVAFVSKDGLTYPVNNDDDFLFGADSLNFGGVTGVDLETKMFFDKSKGAFRAGVINSSDWDEDSIGLYSIAFSVGTASGSLSTAFSNGTASGFASTAFSDGTASGYYSTAYSGGTASGFYSTAFNYGTASGFFSTAFGHGSKAFSYNEVAIGTYNTAYTPNDTINFDSDDRLFVIGNGTLDARSDAMIVYKSGNTEINGTLSITDNIILNDNFLSNDGGNEGILISDDGTVSTSNDLGLGGNIKLNNNYLSNDGGNEGILISDNGTVSTSSYLGLGDNIKLNSNYLSNDGDDEGILISDDGTVSTSSSLSTAGNIFLNDNDLRLRSSSVNHGLGYRDSSNPFNGKDIDGPALYGYSGGALGSNQNGTEAIALRWNEGGNVVIGNTFNNNARFEVDGSVTYYNLTARYYNSGGINGTTAATDRDLSAYFSDHIACKELQVFSDVRMKKVLSISSSKEDLNRLMEIEVTNYQMKDTIGQGSQTIKKVIAQQVAAVYPEAVSKNITRVIPDIYRLCPIENGWISLTEEVKIGDRIRLVTEEATNTYEVLDTREGAFKVALDQEDEVFVYGREVKDFHTVDYEAISMLNVSATQELYKKNQKQQAEINELKAQNQKFQTQIERIDQLESLLNQMQAEHNQ